MSKKMVAIMLSSLILISSTLSACSGNELEDKSATGNPAVSPLKGSDSKQEPRGKIKVTLYDRGSTPASEGTMTDNRWTRWIKENSPVDVEFISIPRWEYAQKLNTLFASGDAPDLIMEYDPAYKAQLYNQKQLLPIDDKLLNLAPTYKAIVDKNPLIRKAGTFPDGNFYVMGQPRPEGALDRLWIRKDWLDKLGLSVPTTVDEFYNVMKKFAESDLDGNKKNDSYGINLSQRGQVVIQTMFGTIFDKFGKQPWVLDEKGKMVFAWPQLEAALKFQKKLYDEQLVSKDFLTDDQGKIADQSFINGKIGIYSTYSTETLKSFRANNPGAELILMNLPKSEFGQFTSGVSAPVSSHAMINKSTKNPEAVMKYIEFMLSPKASEIMWYGFEGKNFNFDATGFPDGTEFSTTNAVERPYMGDLKNMHVLQWYTLADKWSKYYPGASAPKLPANATAEQTKEYEWLKWNYEKGLEGNKLYIDPSRPGATPYVFPPVMPDDLTINQTNGFKAIFDILQKGIVSGSAYSVEKTMADAKKAWETSNGKTIEKWMSDWWDANKDIIPTAKDVYKK